jgi:hypothetical protein
MRVEHKHSRAGRRYDQVWFSDGSCVVFPLVPTWNANAHRLGAYPRPGRNALADYAALERRSRRPGSEPHDG